jgi:hypothetical protein
MSLMRWMARIIAFGGIAVVIIIIGSVALAFCTAPPPYPAAISSGSSAATSTWPIIRPKRLYHHRHNAAGPRIASPSAPFRPRGRLRGAARVPERGKRMSTYTYDLPASPEQLQAIGMVAAEWSYLESIVVTAIWALGYVTEDNAVGHAIIGYRMPDRLKMLRKHFRLRWPDDKDGAETLDKLCGEIRLAGNRRRDVVHGLWVRGDYGSPKIATVVERGSVVKEKSSQKAWQIEAVAALIAEKSRTLQDFLHAKGVVSPDPSAS